jgi:hypothetical protein
MKTNIGGVMGESNKLTVGPVGSNGKRGAVPGSAIHGPNA